ncbi:DUF1049 domain-containing protein [Streptomyces sp. NPDC048606]|uniref:DUF1049 domain-containing protein n=1 Tax=Streptomyces sp. NPDC048606 TaxID=3154726 RepID=UPI003437C256
MTPHTAKGGPQRRGAITPGRVGIAALVVVTLVFIFENRRQTEIRLLVPLVTMPLWVALLISAVLGGICGAYVMGRRSRRR